jgi:hypothetical protein
MDFFQKHDKALRKGRLLQAAAVMLAKYGIYVDDREITKAVSVAFDLEQIVEMRLEAERK